MIRELDIIESIVDDNIQSLEFKKKIISSAIFVSRNYKRNDRGLRGLLKTEFQHLKETMIEYTQWIRDNNLNVVRNEEAVSRPKHYTAAKIEVIDIIESLNLGVDFCLGNAIKYIMRAGIKEESTFLEDVEKANWYITRASSKLH